MNNKKRHFLICLFPFLLFSVLFISDASAQLSPQAQADLLEQQMKRQLVQEKWADALASIEKLETTGAKLDVDILFFKGKALVELGKGSLAIRPLEFYINSVGSSGKGYSAALGLYSRAQEQVTNAQQQAQVNARAQEQATKTAKIAYTAGKGKTVLVPSGSFEMGRSGYLANDNEEPAHSVRINYQLEVGVYEVTFAQWDACRKYGGCQNNQVNDQGYGRGNRPVIGVSWYGTQAFLQWLNETASTAGYLGNWRLLSEAEWEYVARAGTNKSWWWGGSWKYKYANFGKSNGGGKASGQDRWINTSPVGSFPTNRFGLADTASNAEEWVQDCWHNNYSGAPSNGAAWNSGGDCSLRVRRGGHSHDDPFNTAARDRSYGKQGNLYKFTGFRIARTRN